MIDSQQVFVAAGAIGFAVLLISLLLGGDHGSELGHAELGHAEAGHEVASGGVVHGGAEFGTGDMPEPGWLSVRVIAASLAGFGVIGYTAAAAGLPSFASWPIAAAGLLGVGAGSLFLVLKPLARQQYNSLMSRYNWVGCSAVVTLEIEAGGTGRVTFQDRQGARTNQTARSDTADAVAKGSEVSIVDLSADGVVVHQNRFSL